MNQHCWPVLHPFFKPSWDEIKTHFVLLLNIALQLNQQAVLKYQSCLSQHSIFSCGINRLQQIPSCLITQTSCRYKAGNSRAWYISVTRISIWKTAIVLIDSAISSLMILTPSFWQCHPQHRLICHNNTVASSPIKASLMFRYPNSAHFTSDNMHYGHRFTVIETKRDVWAPPALTCPLCLKWRPRSEVSHSRKPWEVSSAVLQHEIQPDWSGKVFTWQQWQAEPFCSGVLQASDWV